MLAIDGPRAFFGFLGACCADFLDRDSAFEEFFAIAAKLALVRVDIARSVAKIGIQDNLLRGQWLGRAVEDKEQIEDALGGLVETGFRRPIFIRYGCIACRHRILAWEGV